MAVDGPVIGVDAGTELTARTAAQLRTSVVDALTRGRTIDFNLGSVHSYDAAGLGLLVGLKRLVEAADGHLVCVGPSANLYSAIRRLHLHRVLDIRLNVPEPRSGTEDSTPVTAFPPPDRRTGTS
jgi:anti-anti-sigma factor